MGLSRLFALGLWLAATVASTSVVWAATSIVAADVTDRPAVVVAHQDVVSELASGSAAGRAQTTTPQKASVPTSTAVPGRAAPPPTASAPIPTTIPSRAAGRAQTTTPQKASVPTSTAAVPGRAAPPPTASAPIPTTIPSRAAGTTVPPPSANPTTTTVPGVRPTTRPTTPPTTAPPPRPTATYSTSGGVVRVACNGFFIELVSAIPSNGYAVVVLARGPGNVDVRFVRSGEEVSVKAICYGQPIRYYDQSPPR